VKHPQEHQAINGTNVHRKEVITECIRCTRQPKAPTVAPVQPVQENLTTSDTVIGVLFLVLIGWLLLAVLRMVDKW
jgi:hypothetical protein